MEHPTTGRHRRPCHSMAGRVRALTAALLATALAALFDPRSAPLPRRVPRALPAGPPASPSSRRGDLLADRSGFPAPDTWAAGASTASVRWEQAYRDRSASSEEEDRVDADPDLIAGALVRPYLSADAVPRPRAVEPEDYPAPPSGVEPESVEEEFAELTDRIRAYLALRGSGNREQAGAFSPAGGGAPAFFCAPEAAVYFSSNGCEENFREGMAAHPRARSTSRRAGFEHFSGWACDSACDWALRGACDSACDSARAWAH